MLAFAAMMEGRRELALSAASGLDRDVPRGFLRQYAGFADGLMATPLHGMIRFGMWDEILAAPAPASFQKMSIASRHYARGVALSALGRTGQARAELEVFEQAATRVPEDWTVGNNKASEILSLERQMLREDLLHHPGNGWALLGLELALREQGRMGEADATAQLLAAAWTRADVQPSSSCYCQPGRALAGGS